MPSHSRHELLRPDTGHNNTAFLRRGSGLRFHRRFERRPDAAPIALRAAIEKIKNVFYGFRTFLLGIFQR
jgi:hypothetical protein